MIFSAENTNCRHQSCTINPIRHLLVNPTIVPLAGGIRTRRVRIRIYNVLTVVAQSRHAADFRARTAVDFIVVGNVVETTVRIDLRFRVETHKNYKQ